MNGTPDFKDMVIQDIYQFRGLKRLICLIFITGKNMVEDKVVVDQI